MLAAGAPVAVGCSGGKDSHALAWEMSKLLADYHGPKLLIHADLGTIEWQDSLPTCERLAAAIGWELVVVRRKAGGMVERWESRWASSRRRYCELSTVAVVLPWSTPKMRFCTGEMKWDPITSALKKRFGKVPILSISGVRAQESTNRAKQPVSSPARKLPPGSISWSALHPWHVVDVWASIQESGVAPHEAYGVFGSGRVSCTYCILAAGGDLRASLSDSRTHDVYRTLCDLELTSGFSFQNTWLSSYRQDLIVDGPRRLQEAQLLAARFMLVPMYVGLILVMFFYNYAFFLELCRMGVGIFHQTTELKEFLLMGALSLLDMAMIANLIVMIMIGSHSIFVAEILTKDFPGNRPPRFLIGLTSGLLKVKLGASLVSVSSIHLLGAFISTEHLEWSDLVKKLLIHGAFILSAFVFAKMEVELHPPHSNHEEPPQTDHAAPDPHIVQPEPSPTAHAPYPHEDQPPDHAPHAV